MTSDVQEHMASKTKTSNRSLAFLMRDEMALLQLIVVALIAGSLLHPAFFTKVNIINILQQSSELSVLVLAQALILIVGKVDLSLESTVGLAPMVAAWLITDTAFSGSGIMLNPYLALVALFAVGVLVGAINGFFVVYLRLNAFITTLAMLILLRGMTVGLTGGKTLYDLPDSFLFLGNYSLLGLPISVWLAALLYLVAGLWMAYTRIGRAMYAVGGNAEAAKAAGIQVDRIVLGVFIVGGALAALVGLMLTGRLASVLTGQGQNMIFTVFAAAVIGRVSLNGGKGSVFGALCGVVLLGIISNILTLSNIETYWIAATYGAIILFSLVLARLTSGRQHSSD